MGVAEYWQPCDRCTPLSPHSSLGAESASPPMMDDSRSQSLPLAEEPSADVIVDSDMLQQTISLSQKCSAESIGEARIAGSSSLIFNQCLSFCRKVVR